MTIKNIAVIGVGGVGGYFGGKLCRLLAAEPGIHLSFIARGEHLRAIQTSGLRLRSDSDGETVCRPSLATDDFGRLPPLDLCLVCVKEFDLRSALSQLKPALRDDTVILPLLNGADVYSRVREVLDNGIVLPACVYVGTHIEHPGTVVQKGGSCRILFGPDPLNPGFDPGRLGELFRAAGILSEWTLEIQTEIWRKFIFICAFGLVSAAHDQSLGGILGDASLNQEARAIMYEAVALAAASGVSLPAGIVDSAFSKARTFPPEARTSFQRDFERKGKPDERDLFAGTLVRMSDALGVEAPATRAISSLLHRRKPAPTSPHASGSGKVTHKRAFVGLIGDQDESVPAHRAIPMALRRAAEEAGISIEIEWVPTEQIAELPPLARFNALWCVPASPYRNMTGALLAIRYAREQGIPFLGTCGGFQHAMIEYARNVLGWADADHAETTPDSVRAVIAPLSCTLVETTGSVRLVPGSRLAAAYGAESIQEGYHCRYGPNPAFRDAWLSGHLRATAFDDQGDVRAVELDGHPFFVATLFQPERCALNGGPVPLARAFLEACVK